MLKLSTMVLNDNELNIGKEEFYGNPNEDRGLLNGNFWNYSTRSNDR